MLLFLIYVSIFLVFRICSSCGNETLGKSLKDMLLEERELSRLGRQDDDDDFFFFFCVCGFVFYIWTNCGSFWNCRITTRSVRLVWDVCNYVFKAMFSCLGIVSNVDVFLNEDHSWLVLLNLFLLNYIWISNLRS